MLPLIIGLGSVGALAIAIATRPRRFHVERSTTVAAPPAAVFPMINNFRRWDDWSPWSKVEPDQEITFGRATEGAGATYAWKGKKTGVGSMEILKSATNERVRIRLQFVKPFKADNITEFVFEPVPEGTRITWSMDGENTLVGKAMSLVASMDKMVGKDFEKGLADIKAQAEGELGTA